MKIKFLLFGLVAALMVSCGASRKPMTGGGDVEVLVPCSGPEYSTSAEYFRANAMGVSTNLEIASQKAMTAARSKLAAAIETNVKTVTDNYLSSYGEGMNSDDRSKFQSLSREVVNQKLKGVRVICQKTMKSPDGQYKCYVAIELAGNDIAAGISNTISADSKLRTDYEYEKFKAIFDKEMQNLANE